MYIFIVHFSVAHHYINTINHFDDQSFFNQSLNFSCCKLETHPNVHCVDHNV